MKKLLLLLLLMGLTHSFAQSVARESSKPLIQFSEPLAVLSQGTEWFVYEGDWISSDVTRSRSSLNGRSYHRIELREANPSDSNESFYSLMIYTRGKGYKYRAIRQDPFYFVNLLHCLIRQSDLDNLNAAINNTTVASRVTFNCAKGDESHFTAEDEITNTPTLDAVHKHFQTPRYYDNMKIYFDVFPVFYEGKNVVRFLWHTSEERYGRTQLDPLVFDKSYIEVDFNNFAVLTTGSSGHQTNQQPTSVPTTNAVTQSEVNPQQSSEATTFPDYCSTPANQTRPECVGSGN